VNHSTAPHRMDHPQPPVGARDFMLDRLCRHGGEVEHRPAACDLCRHCGGSGTTRYARRIAGPRLAGRVRCSPAAHNGAVRKGLLRDAH
jgi:hypothetical protein